MNKWFRSQRGLNLAGMDGWMGGRAEEGGAGSLEENQDHFSWVGKKGMVFSESLVLRSACFCRKMGQAQEWLGCWEPGLQLMQHEGLVKLHANER